MQYIFVFMSLCLSVVCSLFQTYLKLLQTELDTLTSTLRQLEHQKGAAQQRLDDLGNQVR